MNLQKECEAKLHIYFCAIFDMLKFSLTRSHNPDYGSWPYTIDLSTRLWGINPTNSVVIPQSLVLRSIGLGWILMYRNWSILWWKASRALSNRRYRPGGRKCRQFVAYDRVDSSWHDSTSGIVENSGKLDPNCKCVDRTRVTDSEVEFSMYPKEIFPWCA